MEVAALEDVVDVAALTVEEALAVVVAAFAVVELLVQVPKELKQPVPQKSVVAPHQPYWEQQLPKVEPAQVKPVVPPQVPSVETLRVEEGAAEEVFTVEVAALVVVELALTEVELVLAFTELVELLVQVPKALWHPVPQ